MKGTSSRLMSRGPLPLLTLVILFCLPPLAAGLGQPTVGFNEFQGLNVNNITVRDAAWNVRTSMAFSVGETIHVNVTSTTVNWLANAGGGGRRELLLLDYRGNTMVGPVAFWQYGQTPSRYLANLTLTGLAPDWYYLRVRIDDTINIIEARVALTLGSAVYPHSLETFTDDTLGQASEVFTSTSTVWVRIRGDPGDDPGSWDLFDYQGNSLVGGPRGGFPNFQRTGDIYTFSIDLSSFGPYTQGWFYTLEVSLTNGGFAAGKLIELFNPTLAIAGTDLAPARAFQGQTAVPMIGLHLDLNAGWSTTHGPAAFNLERLRFTRTGTAGADADIIGIRIFRDLNGDGVIGAGDGLLASGSALGGLGSPTWVGVDGTTMAYLVPGQTLHLVVAYDISPGATMGDLQGVRLTAAGDVDAGGTVLVSGLPASSSNTQVAAATVTTLTNAGSAPGFVSQGQRGVPMDLLTLQTNGPTVYLASLTLTLTGSANPADVASVGLHRDNGDRVYSPAFDALIAPGQAFQPSGTVTFSSLSVPLGTAPMGIWVIYDISSTAGLGHLVEATIASNISLGVSQGWVLDVGFPLASGQSTVQGPTLLVVDRDLLQGVPQVVQGRSNLPVLSLNLTTSAGSITVTALRVDRGGSSTDLDVPTAKLWLDVNGNGAFDLGDNLLASQAFVGASATFSGLNLVVPTSGHRLLFLVVDIAPSAVAGRTLDLSLANPGYIAVAPPAVVDGNPFGIGSSTVMVVLASNPPSALSLSRVDLVDPSLTLPLGQTRNPLLRLTLTASPNAATVTDLRVDRAGTATDGDVPLVSLWRDTNGNAQLDPSTDILLGTRSFQGGVAVFSALNLAVAAGTSVDLFITVDVSSTATSGATVGTTIRSSDSVALAPPATVAGTNFPLSSGLAKVEAIYGGGLPGATLLYLGLGALVAAVALVLLFLLGKGRGRCKTCHAPVPHGQRICEACHSRMGPQDREQPPPPPGP